MSCLFDSISFFVEEESQKIRNKICDYMQTNQNSMGLPEKVFYCGKTREEYVLEMRKPSSWGGAIEIHVACIVYNLKIYVVDTRETSKIKKKEMLFEYVPCNLETKCDDNVSVLKTIRLFWNGYHYTPDKS